MLATKYRNLVELNLSYFNWTALNKLSKKVSCILLLSDRYLLGLHNNFKYFQMLYVHYVKSGAQYVYQICTQLLFILGSIFKIFRRNSIQMVTFTTKIGRSHLLKCDCTCRTQQYVRICRNIAIFKGPLTFPYGKCPSINIMPIICFIVSYRRYIGNTVMENILPIHVSIAWIDSPH